MKLPAASGLGGRIGYFGGVGCCGELHGVETPFHPSLHLNV